MLWEKIKDLEERKGLLDKEIEKISEEIKKLPNGHLEEKVIKGNKYYYLRYWEDGKLKSKYLGKNPQNIIEKLQKASELKSRLSILKQENEKIVRILEKIEKILEQSEN